MEKFVLSWLLKEEDGYKLASRLSDHALHARVVPAVLSKSPWTRLSERLYHNWYYRNFYLLYALLMIFIVTNFEEPRVYRPGEELTPAQVSSLRFADVLWLLLCSWDLGLQVVYSGGVAQARKRGWLWVKLLTLLALYGNLTAYATYGVPYVARALRPLLLLERMRNVRKIVSSTAETSARLASVVVLLVLNLLLHSILGYLLFAGLESFAQTEDQRRQGLNASDRNCVVKRLNNPPTNCSTILYPPDSCDNYFASLGESTLHMFELMTAVNFPTIALPALKCNPLSALFFISYIVIAVYLLFNLALAVIYAEFNVAMRAEVLLRFSRIFQGLDKSFTLLVAQERGGAVAVRTATNSVAAWGEVREGGSGSGGGGGNSNTFQAGGRARASTAGGAEFDAPGYDDVPSGSLTLATFQNFWAAFRPGMPRPDSDHLASGLFHSFASTTGGHDTSAASFTLDSHGFRRLMLLFGGIHAQKNPTLEDVEDAHIREEYLELEAFYSGPRAKGSEGGGMGRAASPPHFLRKDSVVVGNPLSLNASAGEGSSGGGGGGGGSGEFTGLAAVVEEEEEGITPIGMVVGGDALPSSSSSSSSSTSASPHQILREGTSSPPLPGGEGPGQARKFSTATTSRHRATSSSSNAFPNSFSRGSFAGRNSTAGSFSQGAGGWRASFSRARTASQANSPNGGGNTIVSLAQRFRASFARGSFASGAAFRHQSFSALMDVRRARYLNPGLAAAGGGAPGAPTLPRPTALGVSSPADSKFETSWGCVTWTALRIKLLGVMETEWAAWSFDTSTALAGTFVSIQLSLETDEPGNPYMDSVRVLGDLQFATLAYGLTYVMLRMVAWGPLRFWRRSALNRFDATVLLLTLITLTLGTSRLLDSLWLGETLTFLRIVRLVRVFRFIPGFSSTVLAFRDILPLLGQQIMVLLASLYAFSVVGMHAFGGRLVRSDLKVAFSSYGLYSYYDVFNFDTLPNAYFCQFYLLSVNDWVALMEGCVAATGKIARLYFIVFWPINVLFLFNLVIAFITVAFGAEKDRRDAASAAAEAAEAIESPMFETLDNYEKGEFLAATVFTVGVLDWRQCLQVAGADTTGWLFTRRPRFTDVYDALYKDDVIKTFPGTLHREQEE